MPPIRPLILLLACAAAASGALAQEYTDYHGAWQGQMLFQMANESGISQGAPAVHPGTLEIAADGAVRGQVAAAGCVLSGSSADFVSVANASVDVSLAGCKDAKFNGRFTGKLITNPTLRYASLRLSFTRSLDSGSAQVSAILRR